MKSFQEKTRGMLKNSNEWIKARNEAYKNLKDAHTAVNTKREDYVTVDLDSFYINLIVIPEELECFEIMHIMQYNQILFYLEEDNILRSKLGLRDLRKDMGFSKNDYWPFLVVDSSSEMLDTAGIQGKDNIIEYFVNHGLMRNVRTHSAFETQGLEWIEKKAIPSFDLLKSTFKGKFQFYFTSKNFRYARTTTEASAILRNYLWKIVRAFYFHFKEYSKRKQIRSEIKDRFQIFHELIDEWEQMLSDNRYHGGKEPDAVDFKFYSLCNAHIHMFIMKRLLQARGGEDTKFRVWYQTMHQSCRNTFA